MSLVSLGIYAPLGQVTGTIFQSHVGLLFLIPLLGFYLSIDFFSGLVATLVYVPGFFLGNYWYFSYADDHLKFVMWVQIICWTSQFIGHGVFENRRPALLDNILLTLAAPLFAVLEVMMLFGYKNYLHGLTKENKSE